MKKLYSFLINIVWFILINFTVGINFQTIDDITTSQIVYNNGYNVFSLQWICYLSVLLNKIIPSINGYGLLLVILVFCSSYLLLNIIFNEKNKQYFYIKLCLLLIIDFLILFQLHFTVVGSYCVSVAIILINKSFDDNKKVNLITGIIMFIIGIALRKDIIVFTIPPIMFYIIFHTKNKTLLIKKITTFILLPILCISFLLIDHSSYSSEYKEHDSYNTARSAIFDNKLENAETFLGSSIEYNMLKYSLLGDYNYFSENKLKEINKSFLQEINKPKLIISNFLTNTKKTIAEPFIMLLLLLLIAYKSNKKDIYSNVFICLTVIGYICAYSVVNRFMPRIMFASVLPLILILLIQNREINLKKFYPILIGVILLETISFSGIYLRQNSSRNEFLALKKQIEQNKYNTYFQTLGSLLFVEGQLPALNNQYIQMPDNYFTIYWNAKHPVLTEQLKNNNIKNPILDLVKKENYYLITSEYDIECLTIQRYLKEIYSINSTCNLIEKGKNHTIFKMKEAST